jgi:hypothetical protein
MCTLIFDAIIWWAFISLCVFLLPDSRCHSLNLFSQASIALKACDTWFHAAVSAQVLTSTLNTIFHIFTCRLHQATNPKTSPPPILDTSSSLLLFAAASSIGGGKSPALIPKPLSNSSLADPEAQSGTSAFRVLFGRISALLELQRGSASRIEANSASVDNSEASAGLEAALVVAFCALNDCERERTVAAITHSMMFVLIQAAGSLHGLHVLQRFALTALAGISMSASGRGLLLCESTPSVPPLIHVLTGGERHSAALAALVLGNLALEPAALVALELCAAVFAREVVALMESEEVSNARSLSYNFRFIFFLDCRQNLFDLLLARFAMPPSAAL